MIQNGTRLGPAPARIGPTPAGTPTSGQSLDIATDPFGEHRDEGADADADHRSCTASALGPPRHHRPHDHSHHREREQPT
ncbi:hypothetical protein ACWGCK_19555 [Streptomyces virginiae]